MLSGRVQTDGSLADTAWGSGVDGDALLEDLKTLETQDSLPFAEASGARDVANIVGIPVDGSAATPLAKAVASAAARHLTEGSAFSGREVGSSTEPLEEGYYVVASAHLGEARLDEGPSYSLMMPALIVVGPGDTNLTPKEAAPSLEKQVLEDSSGIWGAAADAETGQDVSFRICASLPDTLMDSDRLRCRIVDCLPSGMELDLDSLSLRSGDADVSELFSVDLSDNVLTLEASELADAELVGGALPSPCEIEISYTARLTASSPTGGVGSINAAHLEVEADGLACSTPESKTALFTYRLEITKVDATDHAKTLEGAAFVLKSQDGRYAVVKDGCLVSWTQGIGNATQLTTGPDGKVCISGLDSDSYALIETKAPDGYRARSEEIPLSIQGELGFDIAAEEGRLSSLQLASGSAASPGDTDSGTLCCTIENPQLSAQSVPTGNQSVPAGGQGVPSTGDDTHLPWAFAAIGTACVASAFCAKKLIERAKKRAARGPAQIAACLLLALAFVVAQSGCMPIRALAQEASELVISAMNADAAASASGAANAGSPEASATETDAASPKNAPSSLVIGSDGSANVSASTWVAPRSSLALRSSPASATRVDSVSDIPRSSANSYINVLNMSYENAYVMVNDSANFAYSGSSPNNTYINWAFGKTEYGGSLGQSITRMVLYKGAPGAYGAGTEMFGTDTLSDSTGKGLVAIWFKDAGVLSDTGEPVSVLLKLTKFQIKPNYEDLYVYMNGGVATEASTSYRDLAGSSRGIVPLLYIFKAAGVDQTDPAKARVWMNSVWDSGQTWEVSFYRSSQVPTGGADGAGFSYASLNLSDDLRVSTASNGESYLTRQYCYDLDITGIRWLDPDSGSYSPDSDYVNRSGGLYGYGGAYLVSAGAESFAWASGTAGSTYISTSSNLKNDAYDGLTYWLHDYAKTAGGTWDANRPARWESSAESGNTDWRNALAADILPLSSFAWVGTGCCTGINLNSQFTGTGTLRLSKTVDDGSSTSFPFRITLESPSYSSGTLSWKQLTGSYPYQITSAGGGSISGGSLSSGDVVSLVGGQTLTVTGIPEGTRYTIVETNHAGYQPTETTAQGTIVADEFLGTIVNGATNDVNIVNVRLFAPADWTIVKKGQSGEKLQDAEFTIRYYAAGNASGAPTRTWVIKSDAEGNARLDAEHRVSGDEFYVDVYGAIGIPVGTFTVEETRAPENYERDSEVRSYQVSLGQAGITCTIPNVLIVENTLLTGTLAVTKRVTGTGADANRAFSFTVRLSRGGSPLSGTFGGLTFSGGAASFTLKAGQTKTIEGIPIGTAFEVSEAQAAGYSVSWENRTGTIAAKATATATATNAYAATGTARLRLTKVFDTNGPALEDGQFTFKLHKDTPEGQVVATSACGADGSIAFELEFDQDALGRTHTYYVTEDNDEQSGVSYDTHAAKVDISVSNNGDGTLRTNVMYTDGTFTNSFRKYQLPSTGLGGVIGALAVGVGLTAGAAAGFSRFGATRRRRR